VRPRLFTSALGVILGTAIGVSAQDRDKRTEIPAAIERAVSFGKDVQPLLAARCGTCHLNGKKSGGLQMDTRELLLAGGASGPVVKVGKSGESELIRLVAALTPDERMPPKGPILSNEHVGILRAWIDQGLKWDGSAAAKAPKDLTAPEAEAAGLCPVQKTPSKLVYHTTIGDQTYHFCCPECKKSFVANPSKYGAPAAKAAAPHAAKPRPIPAASEKLDVAGLAKLIDTHIDKRLTQKKIPVSPQADDAEFLRRLHLDLHGVIPSADKVVRFLDSRDADKRAKLIEELLADPQYGRHMADVWNYLLVPRNTPGCEPAVAPLTGFLERKFQANTGLDQAVRELLTSSGSQKENGAVTYFLANRTSPMVVDSATRVFLAMPMECAQCHDHPYTRWEQTDYWGFASFFNGLTRSGIDKFGVINPSSTRGLEDKPSRLMASIPPPSGERKAAKGTKTAMRLLGEAPLVGGKDDVLLTRPLAAKWLTARDNPFFARAMVNRTWWFYFGRGLVNPVDDMFKPEAVSTHPELLEELSAQFVASGFDVKLLTRAITTSRAYQRTSRPLKENEQDRELYSRMTFRVMTPEQLWDSLVSVFGKEPAMPAGKLGRPVVVQRDGMPTTPRGEFVRSFLAEGTAPTDFSQGIPHALRLLNGLQFNNVKDVVTRIAPPKDDPKQAVETLYLATLSRRPSAAELAHMTKYVERRKDRQTAYEDILWVLLKSSEFVMNR
jgi:YHS domain-containing protein